MVDEEKKKKTCTVDFAMSLLRMAASCFLKIWLQLFFKSYVELWFVSSLA